jgi:hypothetical protein
VRRINRISRAEEGKEKIWEVAGEGKNEFEIFFLPPAEAVNNAPMTGTT